MVEGFFPTLLGAFVGVTGSFIVEKWTQHRTYKRLLDILYVRSDHYVSMLGARANAITKMLSANDAKHTNNVENLLRTNIDAPESYSDILATNYGKYLRAQDIFLLSQCESNIKLLHKDLMSSGVTKNKSEELISVLKQESARRCWLIYSIAWKLCAQFTVEGYSALVEEMNRQDEKRITAVKPAQVFKHKDAQSSIFLEIEAHLKKGWSKMKFWKKNTIGSLINLVFLTVAILILYPQFRSLSLQEENLKLKVNELSEIVAELEKARSNIISNNLKAITGDAEILDYSNKINSALIDGSAPTDSVLREYASSLAFSNVSLGILMSASIESENKALTDALQNLIKANIFQYKAIMVSQEWASQKEKLQNMEYAPEVLERELKKVADVYREQHSEYTQARKLTLESLDKNIKSLLEGAKHNGRK